MSKDDEFDELRNSVPMQTFWPSETSYTYLEKDVAEGIKALAEDIAEGVKNPQDNPLLRLFEKYELSDSSFTIENITRHVRCVDIRPKLITNFALAVPDERAISLIADMRKPIIEIGAGTGYWAYLLSQSGVDIVAYDKVPTATGLNPFFKSKNQFCDVFRGGVEDIQFHPGRVLFLCWPVYDNPMAVDALNAYKGDTLIYVGEGPYGCTASAAFWDALDAGWSQNTRWSIPNFIGIHDTLSFYSRK